MQPPPSLLPPPRPHALPVHRLAVLSVVSALVCCIPILPAALAIIFGVLAASDIQERPTEVGGRELAVTGAVLGASVLCIWIVAYVVATSSGLGEDRITSLRRFAPGAVAEEHTPAGRRPRALPPAGAFGFGFRE